jgi:hypothetical protein
LRLKYPRLAGFFAAKTGFQQESQFFSKNPGDARLLTPRGPTRKP